MDKVVDYMAYISVKARYTGELLKFKKELDSSASPQSEFQRFLKSGIHLLERLPDFYKASNVHIKRDVISSIFPEKLIISETKCRTAKISEAVLLITATDKALNGNKKGQPFKTLELSRQVVPAGIEPASKV